MLYDCYLSRSDSAKYLYHNLVNLEEVDHFYCTVILVQEALKVLAATIPQISPSAPPPAASISPPPPRPPGPVSRLPGTPDSIVVVKELPQRYRRRTLALEEMDYIQVLYCKFV